jgi:ADP-ribose pyrophosphatase YjhB (NUDIX family)
MEPIKKMGIGFGVMILRNGKVLLGQRHVDPIKASSEMHGEGTWTMPGGKLHFGESFEEGAKREIMEETGVMVNANDLEVISVTNDIVPEAHFVTIGMILKEYSGEARVMEPDEITVWDWFPLDQLPSPLFPPSQKILNNYKEGKMYKY